MGGAATVCIQKEDGTRDSYMAYNDGMKIIPNDFQLLSAPVGARDGVADQLFEREDAEYRGEYFEDHPGLAPDWYGLNLVDVANSRVWWCQGQNSLDIIYPSRIGIDYADGYDQNIYDLADNGLLRVCEDRRLLSANDEGRERLPKVNSDQVKELCADIKFAGCFVVVTPDWDRRDFGEDFEKMYKEVKQHYTLTPEEIQRWEAFIEDRRA